MFADTATIQVRAGKGGDGRSSFRHEKYRAMGGPDGGNGGRGGDVIFVADHNQHTLSSYRTQKQIVAEDGNVGGENQKNGRQGEPITVPVPPGTIIRNGDEIMADLSENGQSVVIAKGGRGGFGNAHFKSSVRQAPRTAELGEPGEHYMLSLELKLVADVGLVGLPNAGKSTLLSVVTNAKPAIADYAFTTLIPNLGVVEQDDYGFLIADIPGLIEGASEGKGLGDEFLRHVERTAVLLHLIDVGSKDIMADYKVIEGELKAYPGDLSTRPRIIAITKEETVLPDELEAAKKLLKKTKHEIFVISSQTHSGLTPLLRRMNELVREADAAREIEKAAELPVIDETSLPSTWKLTQEGDNTWRLTGERIEGFARRTNFDNNDGVQRLRNILKRTGVARELRRQIGSDIDELEIAPTIYIGESELEWK